MKKTGFQPGISRIAFAVLTLAALAGCTPTSVDTTYGRRSGIPGEDSVNGTSVLSDLFRQAGFRVTTWRRLSPKLNEFDVIVWFPDQFELPTQPEREFLEDWLDEKSGRVLVYVGRDYDAGIAYWDAMQQDAPPEQVLEVARRVATLQSEFDNRRAAAGMEPQTEWFWFNRDVERRRMSSLDGPWSEGIDEDATDLELSNRVTFPSAGSTAWEARMRQSDELLASDGETLVARLTEANRSSIIVVANGSFLLNLPLVNREHRKLAARLVDACGSPEGRRVAFLETGPGGPLVLDEEPGSQYPTGLELFTVWPLGIIVLHLTALGILCCFALFPIFGRPRETAVHAGEGDGPFSTTLVTLHEGDVPVRAVRAHFGKHIAALGELLERTGDRKYAMDRVKYYHVHVKRDAGGGATHQEDSSKQT